MIRNIYIALGVLYLVFTTSCNETQYPAGKRYYNAYCGNCHMEDGKGLSELIPTLHNSTYIANNQDQLPCIIRYGIKSTVADSSSDVQLSMPAHPQLNDIEVLNICNYINNTWGNSVEQININEMKERLEKCL